MNSNKLQPKFGKKLTLNRETLRELTDGEAMLVAGGITPDGCGTNTCYTSCFGGDCTQGCHSRMNGGTCTVSFIGPTIN